MQGMLFFADQNDPRYVIFPRLRGVFACYDPLPGPKCTGGSRLRLANWGATVIRIVIRIVMRNVMRNEA